MPLEWLEWWQGANSNRCGREERTILVLDSVISTLHSHRCTGDVAVPEANTAKTLNLDDLDFLVLVAFSEDL